MVLPAPALRLPASPGSLLLLIFLLHLLLFLLFLLFSSSLPLLLLLCEYDQHVEAATSVAQQAWQSGSELSELCWRADVAACSRKNISVQGNQSDALPVAHASMLSHSPSLSFFFNSSSSQNLEGLFYHVQSGPNRHDESCYASSEVFVYLFFLNSEAVRTGKKRVSS